MSIEVCGNQRDGGKDLGKVCGMQLLGNGVAHSICRLEYNHDGVHKYTSFDLTPAEKNQPQTMFIERPSQQFHANPDLKNTIADVQAWTREDYLREFTKLTDSMVALTKRKNADYAGDSDPFRNFREFGTMGFLVRMSDKWSRIKNLVGSDKAPQVKDETVEDTLLDLATYSLLLICWLRSGGDKK